MSRAVLILVVLLVLIVGAVLWFGTRTTEVQPVRVEKEMLNDAAAK